MRQNISHDEDTGRAANWRAVAREVMSLFAARRGRWLFSFLATQGAPALEVAFVACLYLIVDPNKRQIVLERAARYIPLIADAEQWSDFRAVSVISAVGLALLLASIGIRYLSDLNMVRLVYDAYISGSRALVGRYLSTNSSVASQVGKSTITSSILMDCDAPAHIACRVLNFLGAILSMVAYLTGAALLSWQVLLVGVLVYGLPLYSSRRLYDRMQAVGRMRISAQEKILDYFGDILDGFNRAKLDGLESALSDMSGRILRKSQKWRVQKKRTRASLRVVMEGFPLLGILAVLYAGTTLLGVKLAVLMVFLVVFNRLKNYVASVSSAYLQIREYLPHAYRYLGLLRELATSRQLERQVCASGSILRVVKLREVSFRYGQEVVLDDVDFEARSGDRILIQGPSGQGKSTLLEVLCGILPPDRGQVLYDGQPLDEELFYKVRPTIAYGAPTVHLFKDTLRANLLMGRASTQDELGTAVRLAGLEEVVNDLPDGLDSPLGTDGDLLSLGQRQRVILARLYLKHPKLVLLDEATSNLDPGLERQLLTNVTSFIDPEAILIMVAHKAPEGIEFNKRYIMEDGKLKPVSGS